MGKGCERGSQNAGKGKGVIEMIPQNNVRNICIGCFQVCTGGMGKDRGREGGKARNGKGVL